MKKLKQLLYRFLPTKGRFTRIYKSGGWGCKESLSGGGSTLAATEPLRNNIPVLLERLDIKSMLDAPCGDFNWMRELLKDAPEEIAYIGADIVKPLINSLSKHQSQKVHFIHADITKDKLPEVDLILSRDCFIHLSEKDIKKALVNFKKTGAKYLATNSFCEISDYRDIETGRWRQINLELPPFNFPPPIEAIAEKGSNGKFLGIWIIEELPL